MSVNKVGSARAISFSLDRLKADSGPGQVLRSLPRYQPIDKLSKAMGRYGIKSIYADATAKVALDNETLAGEFINYQAINPRLLDTISPNFAATYGAAGLAVLIDRVKQSVYLVGNQENLGKLREVLSDDEGPFPHKLKVIVNDPDKIRGFLAEMTEDHLSLAAGKMGLPYPFRGIEVSFSKLAGDLYSPAVELNRAIDYTSEEERGRIFGRLAALLESSYSVTKAGEGIIIKDDAGKPVYYISWDISLHRIKITAGDNRIGVAEPKSLEKPEEFSKEVNRLAGLAQFVANNVAGIERGELPDFTFEIAAYKKPVVPLGHAGLGLDQMKPGNGKKFEVIKAPNVKLTDVGGHERVKEPVEFLITALRNPAAFKKWGARPPKGILLYGPPGTGKTLLAKAIATEAQASFVHVKAADIGSKWYGESEQLMQQAFDEAKKLAGETGKKTILFFDEVDAIAPNREGAHEVTQKVISVILTSMDGIEENSDVIVVGSTNRPQAIAEPLLRPGRLDRLIEIPLPDRAGRRQIFGIHARKTDSQANAELFDSNWLTDNVLDKTDKFSGADIAEIIRRALELKAVQEACGGVPAKVSENDILGQITSFERIKEEKKRIGFGK
ncbi:MAG: ATP-binding protein [Candidatus Saganbacteria bacterium]|nr:ATP-binding protein [Candidatus Saganbacteria bacterium]